VRSLERGNETKLFELNRLALRTDASYSQPKTGLQNSVVHDNILTLKSELGEAYEHINTNTPTVPK